jgi:hypothetical protein
MNQETLSYFNKQVTGSSKLTGTLLSPGDFRSLSSIAEGAR